MYKGVGVSIPLGSVGIYTDDPQEKTPPGAARDARNVSLQDGLVSKEKGSRRLNFAAVSGGVKACQDWFPNDYHQYLLMIGGDGKTYYWTLAEDQAELTVLPDDEAPATLIVDTLPTFLKCGQEIQGNVRKMMILTASQPQIIAGDVTTRRNIPASKRALDWGTNNFPRNGFLTQGRVVLYGCPNNPDTLYISDDDDHEKFQGMDTAILNVFPGNGTGIQSHFRYKGRLFLVKKPFGLYYLNDSDPDPTNWTIAPSIEQFSAASNFSCLEVLDDVIVGNSNGGLTSLSATQKFGDITYGEVFRNLRCERFQRTLMNNQANENRSAIFWSYRKQALFSYQSKGSSKNDYICTVDLQDPSNPKVLWSNKDQANYLALRLQPDGIELPIYASDDGFVYIMDQMNKVVHNSGYLSYYATPHIDFGFANPELSEQNKSFQFLELSFNPTGRWNVYAEIFVDGVYKETVNFMVSYGPVLDDFQLDTARLTGKVPRSIRKPIHGTGRRISIKIWHNEPYQSFEITGLKVYFKVSGNQQKDKGD